MTAQHVPNGGGHERQVLGDVWTVLVIQYEACFLPAGRVEPFIILRGRGEKAGSVEFLHVVSNLVDDRILVGLVGRFVCGVVGVAKERDDRFHTESASECFVDFIPDPVGDVQREVGGRSQFGHSVSEELVGCLIIWVFANLFLSRLDVGVRPRCFVEA